MIERRHRLDDAVLAWFEAQGPQGLVTTDAALVIAMWNRWIANATGIPAERAVGQSLFDVLPSLVERGFHQYYRNALAGEVKVLSHAFHRFIVPTVTERHPEQMPQAGHIVPLIGGGRVLGTMTLVEDVSDRVLRERELRGRIAVAEAASRVKDEFLATLSHEIRTPLNAVLGWTRILKARRPLDEKTLQRAIDVIDRNASAQLTLVTDMLDMARISSGKVRLETGSVDLGAVATAAADVVRPAADAKGIRLVAEVAPRLPPVKGDRDRLLQVAWNLLSNAVKFTEAGDTITVRVAPAGDAVTLSVEDTGAGIDAAFLPHVFERFRQADPSSSRRHGGLGLGLSLVKNLVELHGGSVKASSPGPGHGSIFRVSLPTRAPAPSAISSPLPADVAAADGALAGLRLLLVDDDADAAEIFMRTMDGAGATTVWQPSAASALQHLRDSPGTCPHVIVSDIGMPDDDGYGFLAQLRTLSPERGGEQPVIALTAYVTPEDRAKALRQGFASHIGKPFDPEALIAAILLAARI